MSIESKLEKLQDGKLHLLELIPLSQREQANEYWKSQYDEKLNQLQMDFREFDVYESAEVPAYMYANKQLFKRYFKHE